MMRRLAVIAGFRACEYELKLGMQWKHECGRKPPGGGRGGRFKPEWVCRWSGLRDAERWTKQPRTGSRNPDRALPPASGVAAPPPARRRLPSAPGPPRSLRRLPCHVLPLLSGAAAAAAVVVVRMAATAAVRADRARAPALARTYRPIRASRVSKIEPPQTTTGRPTGT